MFIAQITFGSDGGKPRERDALESAAESYLITLRKNGQIYGEYLFAWSGGNLVAYAYVARPGSLAERYHSEWAKADFKAVVKLFGQSPQCQIIDDEVPKRFPSWKRSTSFYLFSRGFRTASPLRCGDTGSPIPLYLLPLTQETRERIDFWACGYTNHDHIWVASEALEIPAYKQMADPASDLSITGRELCAEVERATGKPTFYYMHRYWGRNVGEDVRPCPLCGGKWHPISGSVDQRPFHQFDFRCERCRLVSHRADSYEDERHARIGEFKFSSGSRSAGA